MAQKKTSNRVTFYQLTLVGPEELIHGFLTGLAIGSGHHAHCYYTDLEDIAEPESLTEKLEEWLKRSTRQTRVIVDHLTRRLIRKHRERMVAETGIVLEEEQRVRAARFSFHYRAYAPRYRDEIDTLLKVLPRGCRLLNHEREEIIDESAKGPEFYTPAHDYELRGSAEVRGRVDRVIEAHHLLDSHPLIEPDEIELELG